MKTSIYLPEDLASRVRALGIPMSEVVQTALRQAVADAEALTKARAQVGPAAEIAVDRLRGIVAEDERAREAERATGRDVGVIWARDYATPRELREFASTNPPGRVLASHSLYRFCDDRPELVGRVDRNTKYLYVYPVGKPWWAGFRQGAALVWEAVQPLIEPGRQR